MIEGGLRASEIAKELKLSKQRVSYHVNKLKKWGHVREIGRDAFKLFEVTQSGKNFLAMYQKSLLDHKPICRAENVRFKASVYNMPSLAVDWHRIQMNNWNQYTTEIDCIKVKLNNSTNPSVEFIPAATDGEDPLAIYGKLLLVCNDVAKELEQTLDTRIGRLELSSKGEWVIHNSLAKTITEYTGSVTVGGVGKINASLPGRLGEFEFHDPRRAAEFMDMPRRVARLEQKIDRLLEYYKVREPNPLD
jgi:hypothetical protein